jgi:hypothetical protein
VVSSTACVPLTQPTVTCVVVLDETSINVADGRISYDTPCGTTTLRLGDSSQQGGSVTSTCEVPDDNHLTKFYHTVVADEVGGGTRQLRCDITVQEAFRRLRFSAGSLSLYDNTGACGDEINVLTHAESRGLITSVVYVLQGAAQQLDQSSGSDRNPLYGLVDQAMIAADFDHLELMVTNGIQTAASVIYGLGFKESKGNLIKPSYRYMDAVVFYHAYSWGTGWKGELLRTIH